MMRSAGNIRQSLTEARRALSSGDIRTCALLASRVVEMSPAEADAHFLLAMALAEAGRIGAALLAIEQAVVLVPTDAQYLAQLARLLTLARREADARAAADRAAIHATDDALVLDTIGCVYARLSDHEAALPMFERAVAASRNNVDFRFNLASTYGFFGRTGDAETQYEAMLAIDPRHGKAHLGIAGLRRQTEEGNHVARLEAALANADDPTERLRIHYAAAKEYEDLGDHDAVFRHLSNGNAAHKKRLDFTIDADVRNMDAIRSAFARPDYFTGESHVESGPIFIIGMPRTGTTLVDRILSAHPDVQSAGELQAMPLAIKRLSQSESRLVLDPDTIARSGALSPDTVGRAYMDRARQHAGTDGPVFIDKFPLNFLYVGYIARALPNARIVCLRRGAMDSVWSNFKHLFATTSSYYAWSYDLMDTARYYALFDRMMAFWRDMFPGRLLELGYEALIADQEGETRRLLAHCGLAWDDACLDFHRNTAAVATPSAQQVRRPLNAGSVGKWRDQEKYLHDVMQFFVDAGISPEPEIIGHLP